MAWSSSAPSLSGKSLLPIDPAKERIACKQVVFHQEANAAGGMSRRVECLEGKVAKRQLFAAVQEHVGGHSCQLFKHRCIGAMRHNICACLLAEESDVIYVIEVSVGNEHVA